MQYLQLYFEYYCIFVSSFYLNMDKIVSINKLILL